MGGEYANGDVDSLRMRKASGEVDDRRRLVCFLYLLARNHLPVGTIESIWKTEGASVEGPFQFTNGWLATWAQDMADRLSCPFPPAGQSHFYVIRAIKDGKIPVGQIPEGGFTGAAVPEGYLLCDGSAYSKFEYPDLYTCIGNAYGTVVGKEDMFRVPDMRLSTTCE
jgi:hypothetical protein